MRRKTLVANLRAAAAGQTPSEVDEDEAGQNDEVSRPKSAIAPSWQHLVLRH